MVLKIKILALLPFFSFAVASYFHSITCQSLEERKERELVKMAIMDYVEGIHEADTNKIFKSVHPTLVKRGTSYDEKNGKYSSFKKMNFQQLVDLSKNPDEDVNRAEFIFPGEVTIYDVQSKTASAKVDAARGTDYFHLGKIKGKWYIMNVLWQTNDRT